MLAGRLQRNSRPALSSSPLELFVCQQHQMLITLDARNTWQCMTHSCVGLSGLTASRDDGGKKAFKTAKAARESGPSLQTLATESAVLEGGHGVLGMLTPSGETLVSKPTHKWVNRPG